MSVTTRRVLMGNVLIFVMVTAATVLTGGVASTVTVTNKISNLTFKFFKFSLKIVFVFSVR